MIAQDSINVKTVGKIEPVASYQLGWNIDKAKLYSNIDKAIAIVLLTIFFDSDSQ